MTKKKNKYKFADLFAGIGGFHQAFHSLGCECVFASEIDKEARKTYEFNFRHISPKLFHSQNFVEDIIPFARDNLDRMPDFDILCAGFPCQPFSQAGIKLGFKENYEGRGNMFYVLKDIIKHKRPSAFFLENVRNIENHDKGNTFRVIRQTLEEELGYHFKHKIVKASDFNLPQHRPRMFMVGFDRNQGFSEGFDFPEPIPEEERTLTMSDVLGGNCTRDKEGLEKRDIGYTLRVGGRGSVITDRRNWEFYYVDGEVRRISVEDGKQMMGLPKSFILPDSVTQAFKQLGNSVAVPAVTATAKKILEKLNDEK